MGISSCRCNRYDTEENEMKIGEGVYGFKKMVNKIF